ncbi:DUF2460 domain-containing protein [Hyphomonas sp. FCG-A18]|uniref:phage distal tail protein, Rcc01695 family n=1 Tax=Hyphomonas sp. FCG-A18 TaxID=3080019 RepID=UPI002B2E3E80|nr:DUF2460 domain-containing protein [Hyphomonas sp. FCG-A18]
MQNFDDVRFPLVLAQGARGGPERLVEVLKLASGREVRGSSWAGSRRRWDVSGAVDTLDRLYEIMAFFEARQGPLKAFRFRDPLDHSSARPGVDVSALDQVLGLGDGVQTRFALRKAYGDVWRSIRQPVESSVQVALDFVTVVSGWQVEEHEIVFDVPPAVGVAVSAGFEFDCVVRFENERFEGVVEAMGTGRATRIGLVEVV